MWRIEVSAAAESDIGGSALWYEGERSGLGPRFEDQVDKLFARLAQNPFQFPEVERNARRALLSVFPYGVYFTVGDEVVTVLAVLHLHRHPETWKVRRRD